MTPDHQLFEAQKSASYATKWIVGICAQFHSCQMLGYVEDGEGVTGDK